MTRPLLRALIIGAGYMGGHHLAAYRSHPATTPVAAVARTDETAARVARAWDVATFTDVALALAATKPDLVSVCSPTPLHAVHGELAVRAGAHVLVEKPLAHSVAAGRALIAAASCAGRTLAVAHTLLYEAGIPELVRLAAAGVLGSVREIRFERQGQDVSPGEVAKGRGPDAPVPVDAAAARGQLYDHLVHVTYVLNRLAGGALPAAVSVAERQARRFDDRLTARTTYRNGVQAHIRLSSSADVPFGKRLRVVGTAGSAEWEGGGGMPRLTLCLADGVWRDVPLRASASAFTAVVRAFVAAVLSGRPADEGGDAGLRAMAHAAALAGGWPDTRDGAP